MNKRLEIKNENKELNAKCCFKLINGKPIGWIPLEEKYYQTFKIKEKCDFIVKISS